MKRLLMFLLAGMTAAMLCACGSQQPAKQEDPIVGKWELTKMADKTETGNATGAETVYAFDNDGTMTGIDNGKAVSGTWKKITDSSYVVTINNSDQKYTLGGNTLIYEADFGDLGKINFIFERK